MSMPSQGPTWNSHCRRKGAADMKSELHVSSLAQDPCCHVDIYLRRHHFGVGAADFDPCVETCLVVALHDVASKGVICSHPTVVRSWMGMIIASLLTRKNQHQKCLISNQQGIQILCLQTTINLYLLAN